MATRHTVAYEDLRHLSQSFPILENNESQYKHNNRHNNQVHMFNLTGRLAFFLAVPTQRIHFFKMGLDRFDSLSTRGEYLMRQFPLED